MSLQNVNSAGSIGVASVAAAAHYSLALVLVELAAFPSSAAVAAAYAVAATLKVGRWWTDRERRRGLLIASGGALLIAVSLCFATELVGLPRWAALLLPAAGALVAWCYVVRRFSSAPRLAACSAENRERVQAHYDTRAPAYGTAQGDGAFHWVRRREVQALLELLAVAPGQQVLDAGCGPGEIARELCERGGKVHGVDLSPQMLERARPFLETFTNQDIEQLNLGRSFDTVLCAGALEFAQDPQQAFSALAQHLSPEGRLVLLVPVAGMGGAIYREVQRLRGLRVHLFTTASLRRWAQERGLVLTACRRPFLHCRVLRFERSLAGATRLASGIEEVAR